MTYPAAQYDAVVIGAGPNGLAAAITLARAGRSVIVFEAGATVGGGCRTKALTLPGFLHDVCSAIHPLALGSPFFRSLPLQELGVQWVMPPLPLAHPLPDGQVAVLHRSIAETGATLGNTADAAAYRRLLEPLVEGWQVLMDGIEGPLRPLYQLLHPQASLVMARFGVTAIRPARSVALSHFRGEPARALFAGMSAHAILPLDQSPSAAAGLVLAMLGHAVGWPFPQGGSQSIANAMATYLLQLGGEIVIDTPVTSLAELPTSRMILCDVTPRQLLALAGDRLPAHFVRQMQHYRYGPGVFKLDLALDGPIPWRAAACADAGTVHVGGTLAEIAASERAPWDGVAAERPFVLVGQQSLFDPTRAPEGKQTVWAYCHVPHGYEGDRTEAIEAQIERFAPGFRDRILARHTMNPAAMERYNANYIGGDINGGVQDLAQLFTRPTMQLDPYATPIKGLYLCSSSTPPGGGVHGMCGYYAAQSALRTDAQKEH